MRWMTVVQLLAGAMMGIFLLPHPEWLLGPHSIWISWALALWGKRPGNDADHLPPSSAIFMAWCLIKQEILLHGVVLS
jgi:hypothetical protein